MSETASAPNLTQPREFEIVQINSDEPVTIEVTDVYGALRIDADGRESIEAEPERVLALADMTETYAEMDVLEATSADALVNTLRDWARDQLEGDDA